MRRRIWLKNHITIRALIAIYKHNTKRHASVVNMRTHMHTYTTQETKIYESN